LNRTLLLALGWTLVLLGGYLAHAIQTSSGVEVKDVRIPLDADRELAALLYLPPNATPETPAPAVLAVHGYINSRETQSAFAIELARRGHVVLAIDQTGHGFSAGPAFRDGFGGPAALSYLRGLPQVDSARIAMEGHSMGGWAIQAAATAMPDAYRSITLVGSSTGRPFAAPGTATSPRNTAVVFSTYDEFSRLMWSVPSAREVVSSPKLAELFGSETPIEPGRIYGAIEQGTARRLTTPRTTHPGDHLSTAAVADVLEWIRLTLGPVDGAPGASLTNDAQIWPYKELGTLLALLGGVLVLLGAFDVLLALPWLSAAARPGAGMAPRTGPRWWISLLITAAIPALSYFPLVALGGRFSGLAFFPQNVTNQLLTWAVANGVLGLVIAVLTRQRIREGAVAQKIVLALASVAMLYVAVLSIDLAFTADMRFWVVALKPMAAHHVKAFLAYLLPFTAFFYVSLRLLATLTLSDARALTQYAIACGAMAGGIVVLVATIYAWLFANGSLPGFADPLFSIVALQLVAVLTVVAIVAIFTWRRTDGPLAGALICGAVVTGYVVAGQAMHV